MLTRKHILALVDWFVRIESSGLFSANTRAAVAPEPSARTEVNAGREVPALVRARRVGGSVATGTRSERASGLRVTAKTHEDTRGQTPLARGRVRPAAGRRGGPGRLGGVRSARAHIDPDDPDRSPQAVGGARRPPPPPPSLDRDTFIGGVYGLCCCARTGSEMMCSVIVKPPGFMYVA